MNIGDEVKFEDPFSETLIGIIVGVKTPKCKCKGKGYYIIDFGGIIKKIELDDKRLSLYKIEPKTGSLSFNFK